MNLNKSSIFRSSGVQNLWSKAVNMKNKTSFLGLALCGLTLCVAQPAFAGKASAWSIGTAGGRGATFGMPSANGRMSLMQVATSAVALSQVLETINAQEPGTQLDTNTVVENGRTIYVVRWQASRGRIIIFRVDAETGQIIGRQG
jgi:hypothetical protein